MDRHQKVDLIEKAFNYRSGNDSCNSVYMGSMARHSLFVALGGSIGGKDSLRDLLDRAHMNQIDKAYRVCENVISYMLKHPTKKCPTCGAIVRVD